MPVSHILATELRHRVCAELITQLWLLLLSLLLQLLVLLLLLCCLLAQE